MFEHNLNVMQNRCWKRDAHSMPPPIYTDPSSWYQPSGSNGAYLPFAGSTVINQPPNMRDFYMPTGSPYHRTSAADALGIPPFLFNRMPQVRYSFPFPPPLPQIDVLHPNPFVQQMFPQQYANPTGIFPYISNYPMAYPQGVSQQWGVPISAQGPYVNNGYPNVYQAFGPTQYRSAHQQVPIDATRSPYHPKRRENVYNPPTQQPQAYPYINRSVVTRPWLHQMPSIPPGAVIISDEYIPRNNIPNGSHLPSYFPTQHPRTFNTESQSTITSVTVIHPNQSQLPRRIHTKSQSNTNCSSITTTSVFGPHISSSSSSSCSLCRAQQAKDHVNPSGDPNWKATKPSAPPEPARLLKRITIIPKFRITSSSIIAASPPNLIQVFDQDSDSFSTSSTAITTLNLMDNTIDDASETFQCTFT